MLQHFIKHKMFFRVFSCAQKSIIKPNEKNLTKKMLKGRREEKTFLLISDSLESKLMRF